MTRLGAGLPKPIDGGPGADTRRVRIIVGIRTCDSGLQGPENLILPLADVLRGEGVRYVIVIVGVYGT